MAGGTEQVTAERDTRRGVLGAGAATCSTSRLRVYGVSKRRNQTAYFSRFSRSLSFTRRSKFILDSALLAGGIIHADASGIARGFGEG
jgi:hypothetical protein